MKRIIVLLLCLSGIAAAQNVRYSTQFPSVSSTTTTPFLVANVPPNSPILAVCNHPANAVPCTNYATTYTSTGSACANGAQDTPDPQPSACQATGDAQGNIGFWAPAGEYDYTICIENTTTCFGPYTITLGATGTTFTAGGNLAGNATAQAVISEGPYSSGSAPECVVDGVNHTSIAACMTYLSGLGFSSSGTIVSYYPEDFTTNIFALNNWRGKVILGHQTGSNTDYCTTSAPFTCWTTEVPLVLPTHLVIEGVGNPSRSQGAFNSGTVISFGNSFPAPLGPPSAPSLTCSSTGGSLSNGTYYVQIWYVNNLLGSSNNGNANATPGYGLASTETNVICAGGTSTQKITFSMPSGAGSGQYAAQDVAVGVALSGDGAATAASNGTGYEQENHYGVNLSCNTQGVVDTNACAISGGGTITISGYYTQSSQSGMPPPEVDLSNPMITLGTGIPGIANNAFSVRLQHLTLSGMGGGTNTTTPATNEPAVLLSDFVAQEQSGCDDCTFTGPASQAYLFTGYKGGNSYYSHIHMPSNDGPNTSSCAAPVCDGQWIPIVVDGRGASNGGMRWGNDMTIAARCSGCGTQPTTPEMVLVTGTAAALQFASLHEENDAGGDGILVDKGAGIQLDSITGFPNSGKCMVHLTTTANVAWANVTKDGKGYCAVLDDSLAYTMTPASNQGLMDANFLYGNLWTTNRLTVDAATTLINTNFALSAGWGTTASAAMGVTTSKDSAFVVIVTSAGTGQAANPTVTLTFANGTWTKVPVCQIRQTGGTGSFNNVSVTSRLATAYTWSWLGTPAASSTYEFTGTCTGT